MTKNIRLQGIILFMDTAKYPKRTSPRLKDYDYAQYGAYFVTIIAHKRASLFGRVDEGGVIHCNEYGQIVWACWHDLPNHYDNIQLDQFIVMPNHVHGIIFVREVSGVREGLRPSPTTDAPQPKQHTLTEIVRALKSFSARGINEKRDVKGVSIWQRSFHDRIIRNEAELNKLREYVIHNPALWAEDRYYY